MNLYHLRYFVTLAQYEHYTRAAQELMITQPSLSHAIAAMEEELKVKLFEKEGRNIVLTRFGHIFLGDVKKSLAILDHAISTMQMAGTGAGTIELGFLRTLGTKMVPRMMRRFLDSHMGQDVHFNLSTGVTKDLLRDLVDRKLDLAICSYDRQYENQVSFVPIATQELVLLVHKDHPLAERDAVDLTETLDYPHIFFSHSSGLRPVVDSLFDQIDAHPTVLAEVQEDQVIAGLVSENFGIAVVPYMPILKMMPVKIIAIKSPSWERNFYLAYVAGRYMPPVVQDFKTFITEKKERETVDL